MKFRLVENLENLFEAKRTDWTVDEIKDILARNDAFVGRSLVKLYELQTAGEKTSRTTHEVNHVGFSSFDADILSSFAEFYMKYGRLSEKQLAIARKKIMKYAKQLVKIANGTLDSGSSSSSSPKVAQAEPEVKPEVKPVPKVTGSRVQDVASFFESLDEGLTSADINRIRTELHHKLSYPTAGMMIQPDGRFSFNNISESEGRRLVQLFNYYDLASEVYLSKGNIDFGHYNSMGQPKTKCNVTGRLNIEELLTENYAKLDEDSDKKYYRAELCWDESDLNDDVMWSEEYFKAASPKAVIEYIDKTFNPYKIMRVEELRTLTERDRYIIASACNYINEDFVNYNANPQDRNEGDCTIRALSLAYNMNYNNVKSELTLLGNKNKAKFNVDPTIAAFMEKHRYKKHLDNETGTANVSTVESFAKKYRHGIYVVKCSDRSKQDMSHSFHLVTIIDGKIYDTWDSASYFVIEAWEIAANGKRILNNKGITEEILSEDKDWD